MSLEFKVPLARHEANQYLKEVLLPLCEVYPSGEFFMNTLDIGEKTGYSYYDAMIIEAAITGNCSTLFSEDLHQGHKIGGLMIKNPFA